MFLQSIMCLYLRFILRQFMVDFSVLFSRLFYLTYPAVFTKVWWEGWLAVGKHPGNSLGCQSSCSSPRKGWQKLVPRSSLSFPSLETETSLLCQPQAVDQTQFLMQTPLTLSRVITTLAQLRHSRCWWIAKFCLQGLWAANFRGQASFIDF